ncbi:MAG: ATP-dependent RecD-like DNA helicase, partial [Bacilli bacterium]|nr:ATP-dependent RecD-like DNA helicase [Bacilli bacterium]
MHYIKGKVRQSIFASDNGFFVGTFKLKETDEEALKEFLNKTITITGTFVDLNTEDTYILYGDYKEHERYGYQYQVIKYEKEIPTGEDAIIEFLSSPLIKGCGEKTAIKIVETLGSDCLNKIKESISNLYLVPGMTEKKAGKIYTSILAYSSSDDLIVKLKTLGFSVSEATKIINRYKDKTAIYIEENLYIFQELIDFDKIDRIFIKNYDADNPLRIRACILESMKRLSDNAGDIYYYKEEIYSMLKTSFKIFLEEESFNEYLEELKSKFFIIEKENRYYLEPNYEMEQEIAKDLYEIATLPEKQFKKLDEKIENLEESLGVSYNDSQKKAIKTALQQRITIISGGPGTGKTTIVNAIVKLFISLYHLTPIEVYTTIACLAPTGRASKKLAMSTGLPDMTIHRYLKWNKDNNEFQIKEHNKNTHRLIIVDEVSMIDTFLLYSLLKGIEKNIQIIFVGDTFQLPSVGAGLILNDLVESDLFSYCPLNKIYRQSENSYIPLLAKEIKDKDLSATFLNKTDDYNFLPCNNSQIKEMIYQICEKSIQKGLRVDDIQILAPMYKGENGIDNLNIVLQRLFNPESKEKKEIKLGDITFREGDKVLQLINNPDCNVYNGDIGYIKKIEELKKDTKQAKKEQITIDFDGNYVIYNKEDLFHIKHAYAITIHKSQGSEFPHVILPVSKNYYKMLYNKLIYTGVSRAKKSLIIIGDTISFKCAIQNDYSTNRKTTLKETLKSVFKD